MKSMLKCNSFEASLYSIFTDGCYSGKIQYLFFCLTRWRLPIFVMLSINQATGVARDFVLASGRLSVQNLGTMQFILTLLARFPQEIAQQQ